MEEQILKILRDSNDSPLNAAEFAQRLNLPPSRQAELTLALKRLERAGHVARIKKDNRYALPLEADLIPGRLRMNRQGGGLLQPSDPNLGAISVAPTATGTAMHGDRVLVRRDVPAWVRGPKAQPRPPAGSCASWNGAHADRRHAAARPAVPYVIPDDPRIPHDIYVPPPRDVGRPAQLGDKVVVELRRMESRHTNPEGEIIEVLGAAGRGRRGHAVGAAPIQLAAAFPEDGPAGGARLRHAASAPPTCAGRVDCRRHQVITIDPDDAKDFDDAICLERLGRTNGSCGCTSPTCRIT